jgi:histidinol-phosphate aminotransferase
LLIDSNALFIRSSAFIRGSFLTLRGPSHPYNPRMAPKFVRKTIREMSGYEPGEQPAAGTRWVKLNTNENPFPPGESVMRAIRELPAESLRRYPPPLADVFRTAAGKMLGVSPDCIIAGNGSDDILTIATRTFVPPGGTLAFPSPTYSLYPVLASLEDAKTNAVPWEKDWSLPVAALAGSGAEAIYLANPNAPSGTFIAPTKVAELAAAFGGLLLIDEAYADFADGNCLGLLEKLANVVIVRTLSKAYSLAGLRFGYGIARPEVIAEMMKVKDSYNCDAISIAAATAAIADQAYAQNGWEHVKSERQRVSGQLKQLGWSVIPSQANFIFATPKSGDGKAVYQRLKDRGILVRHFDSPGLCPAVRITIGSTPDNDALLAAVRALA